MGAEDYWETVPPTVAPLNLEREEHWRRFDNSVNAVSFGFVATAISGGRKILNLRGQMWATAPPCPPLHPPVTAILISMFLVMAIFERFLRPRSLSSNTRTRTDLETQTTFNGKLDYPSPKMTIYANGVSVLMPGEETPTFIAHPATVPCPPDRILKPLHQHNQSICVSSTSSSSSS